MLVIVYYLIFRLYFSKWLFKSKAEILDNKQQLTSILFIPRMFKLLAILLQNTLLSKHIDILHLTITVQITQAFQYI